MVTDREALEQIYSACWWAYECEQDECFWNAVDTTIMPLLLKLLPQEVRERINTQNLAILRRDAEDPEFPAPHLPTLD